MKKGKYNEQKSEYVLKGYYCNKWAVLCTYDQLQEAIQDLQAYEENEPGIVHLITVRPAKH